MTKCKDLKSVFVKGRNWSLATPICRWVYRWVLLLITHHSALQHHATEADPYHWPGSSYWIPKAPTVQSGRGTFLIPPTVSDSTPSIRILVVVYIRSAELHPVWLPVHCVVIVESVICVIDVNKKAELSQRWPRDAPYTWVSWKWSRVPEYVHAYFFRKFLMGFCSDRSCECAYKIWSS